MGKSDPIQLVKHNFRSAGIGESEIIYKVTYPSRWGLSMLNADIVTLCYLASICKRAKIQILR
jgi:hypothetical protein